MKIAICDDCLKDAQEVKNCLGEGNHDIRIYTSAEAILADVQENVVRYDLYLLDIFLKGSIDGIALARSIRRHDAEAAICFVSASDGFYREAYDLYAVQYLLKPVRQEDIDRLLEWVSRSMMRDRGKNLIFKWRGGTRSIPYGEILYINSSGRTVFIHCKDGTVQETSCRLAEIADKICGDIFWRCHQSFIVNIYQVAGMKGRDLIVGNDQVPISRRYYAQIKERYQKLLLREAD